MRLASGYGLKAGEGFQAVDDEDAIMLTLNLLLMVSKLLHGVCTL